MPDSPPSGFTKLWAAAGVSNLGDGVMGVAFPLLVASITRDPLLVAGATVANRIPWFLFALVSGALVDRMDRKRVMVVTDSVRFLLVGLLGVLLLAGDVGLPIIYAVAFGLGTAETFFDTSAEAIIPALVEPDRLESANGRLQATEWAANSFLGPPLGAALFVAGAGLPFIFDSISFLVAALLIATIGGTYRAQRTVEQTLGAEIGEGLHWLWGHTVLRTLSLMAGVTNLVAFGVIAIFVLFIQDIIGLGDFGYGVILSVMGVGGLLGALVSAKLVERLGQGTALISSVSMLAILAVAMGSTSSSVVVAVIGAMFGLAITMWNVVAISLRQRLTPDELRGRVASVARLLAWGTQPLGALLGGLVAGSFGLRAPFFVAAAVWVAMLLSTLGIINNRRIAELVDEVTDASPSGT